MRKLTVLRRLALTLTITAVVVIVCTWIQATVYDPSGSLPSLVARAEESIVSVTATSTSSSIPSNPDPADPHDPAQIIIPTIGVKADIKPVGLTAKNTLATPGNLTSVGWYEDGTIPGELGSAVMDGHIDNGLGFAGVFKNLSQLKAGDQVYVVNKAGQTTTFTVTAVNTYPYDSIPDDSLFYEHDAKILRLLSCTGSWVPEGDTYNQRIVVTAVMQ